MNKSGKGSFLTYTFLVSSMIFWGISFVWYKQALEYFPPVSLVICRLIISVPLLLALSFLLKRQKKINKKDLPLFLLMAFFEPFLYFLGESRGMLYISSTVASIIVATIPIFTAISSFIFFKEKLTTNNYLGFLVSFIGVFLVIWADREKMNATYLGLLLMALAVFSAVGYGMFVNRIADKYNSLTIVSTQNILAILYFLPIYLIFEHKKMMEINWTFQKMLPMILLAVFSSTLAYLGLIQGIKKIGVSKATAFTNFVPIFTAIFAYFILDDQFSGTKLSGIILVIFGLILSQQKKKEKESTLVNELY